MKNIVLINNYNYEKFLDEALDSIRKQMVLPDFVIVVDDGSTDDSVEVVKKYSDMKFKVELIQKKNGGQLSCFNAAIDLISPEDIVFFLDSDDLYPPDYIKLVQSEIDNFHDFYFSEVVQFKRDEVPIVSSSISSESSFSIPVTSAVTRRYGAWVGSPTSALVIKGAALKEILPYKDERNFITRADDVLVYGSSILGHRKKYLPAIAIAYRIHGANNFYGKKIGAGPLRNFAIEKLFNYMSIVANVVRYPLEGDAYLEAKSIKNCYRDKLFIPKIRSIYFHLIVGRLRRFFGFL